MADAPRVFISYSHDNDAHKAWVRKLAADLRSNGIDAILDCWELGLGDDVAAFMERGVSDSDRVLVICSSNYVKKANAGKGGVGYEKMIVTAELIGDLGTKKFIPLIRNAGAEREVPDFLGSRLYIDFDDDTTYKKRLEQLLREIHEQPALSKPPLGTSPFVAADPKVEPSPYVQTFSPDCPWDTAWIEQERAFVKGKFCELSLASSMEICFALDEPKPYTSQVELLKAAKAAQIETFGWPIGIVLDGKETRPKPRESGLFASVLVKEHNSYDYWAIQKNGDLYLFKSLFEDMRKPGEFFFNTRIVRTTETLMYCFGLYHGLGISSDVVVHIRIRYDGLKGRELSSSTRKFMYPQTISQDSVESTISIALGDIEKDMAPHVKALLDPVFILFDFFTLSDDVYTDIVNGFVNGHVT